MNCAYCGKRKKLFESLTKYGFCPACNQRLRNYIKNALNKLRAETPLCDPERAQGTTAELLEHVARLKELVEKLEDLRPRVPFFRSSTQECQEALALYRKKLESGDVPEAILNADRDKHRARSRYRQVEELLAGLPRVAVEANGDQAPDLPAQKYPAIHCGRLLPVMRLEKVQSFYTLTIQTTGLTPHRHEIIELAALRFENFLPVQALSTFLVPRHAISSPVEKACGITNELVRGAPLVGEALPVLQDFLWGDLPIVGYQLEFDLRFLCTKGLRLEAGRKYYDLLPTAQAILVGRPPRYLDKKSELPFDVENYSFECLCDYYGVVRPDLHNSLGDCYAMGVLFDRLSHAVCKGEQQRQSLSSSIEQGESGEQPM